MTTTDLASVDDLLMDPAWYARNEWHPTFRMLRHEGKLTGLAAYGEPKLADEMVAQFRFNNNDGLIETDFKNWFAMRRVQRWPAAAVGRNKAAS